MSGTIQVQLRFFSHVKQALGQGEMNMELPMDATTRDLERRLRELADGVLADFKFRIAVNQEYVQEEKTLADRDEVALIPPVQGG